MKATICVDDPKGYLPQLFAAEQKRLVNDRASYQVSNKGAEAIIEAEAQDAVAMRAVLNSICKILIVHTKAKQVLEDGN